MSTDTEQSGAVYERDLGSPAAGLIPASYPHSLALCIIDAVYVAGARHVTVEKIIERYRGFRAGQGCDADVDGVPELLANIDTLGGPQQWASEIGNRRPTSTAKNAPLRSAALAEAAQVLVGLGIRTTEDLRALAQDLQRYERARAAWCSVPGQRSGFTWSHLMKLAHVDVTVHGSCSSFE